ncbi:unnamed protein product, partial [Linum tenue]
KKSPNLPFLPSPVTPPIHHRRLRLHPSQRRPAAVNDYGTNMSDVQSRHHLL